MKLIQPDFFTLCIGGGNFGTKAAIQSRDMGAVTLAIDPDPKSKICSSADVLLTDPEQVEYGLNGKIQVLNGDGCKLFREIFSLREPDIVVPAAPGHLIAKVAKNILYEKGMAAEPFEEAYSLLIKRLDPGLVQIEDRENAVVVTSYMDEGKMCIENCNQPKVCPVTKKVKELPMHKLLWKSMEGLSDNRIVLHSLLLNDIGGVGGIIGKDISHMLQILDEVEPNTTISVATSCSCHGITNLLKLYSEKHNKSV